MQRSLTLAYGLTSYALFLAVFVYAVLFVEDVLVPKTIDRGGATGPVGVAIAIDLALLSIFALQHSVMARRGFKERWTKLVPRPIERSTYVLASSVVLALLMALWRPLPEVVWSVEGPLGTLLTGLSWGGWGLVLVSTFVIDHFDLFGVRQVVGHARGVAHAEPVFQERSLYRYTRHPLYLGFLLAFWCAPEMTAGHLLFAAVTTGYVLVAIQLEERDLVRAHGEPYREYKGRVPMLLPLPRRPRPATPIPRRS